jgi:Guanylate-kinase-associated protein (GKAP) protein
MYSKLYCTLQAKRFVYHACIFVQLLGAECERLLAMADVTEKEMEATADLPEEASGKLRSAIGQARLLVRQKLQQFEGLCHRNLVSHHSYMWTTFGLSKQMELRFLN